ncbi:uncharacterized protein LOC122296943 [Carya illinoinensis]|uniref:uncharacterized protein LOC122296943 n=1 Tax=Carya illinoinensis TaxID=32201 RepID=UPI001C724049|nr:uncharacterized protein LOC122296943 [Carya illinoinensis]
MLEAVEKFEKAFRQIESEDYNFLSYFDDGHMGPPKTTEWEIVWVFVKFFEMFYEATTRFSGSLYVTANTSFLEICDLQTELIMLSENSIGGPRSKLGLLTFHLKKIHDEFRAEELVSNVRQLLTDLYAEYNATFDSTMSTPVSQPLPTSRSMNEGDGKRETKWFQEWYRASSAMGPSITKIEVDRYLSYGCEALSASFHLLT